MKFTFLLSLIFSLATAVNAAQGTDGENPYNWIVDHIRESPGKRIIISKAILCYGFEFSCLLRDTNQKLSVISVSFDDDVIKVDNDFSSTRDAYEEMRSHVMNTKREAYFYEMSVDVEIRPFPRLVTVNGETHEGGYGNMGACPFGIVVKRIYSLKLIKVEKEPNQSPEPMPMAVTPPAAQASRQP